MSPGHHGGFVPGLKPSCTPQYLRIQILAYRHIRHAQKYTTMLSWKTIRQKILRDLEKYIKVK
jgi:hypothetical protein